ncbi:unnamed protein product [Protopolystoma xenopodis]|uniref:Uncharacterized protein n=1 Tax=Protopolystoma xenopodis TaxID=117903 RepID=A0A3S5A1J5_9PLAT|nr:unnamed protein product [Protopolystoma xenopodis]
MPSNQFAVSVPVVGLALALEQIYLNGIREGLGKEDARAFTCTQSILSVPSAFPPSPAANLSPSLLFVCIMPTMLSHCTVDQTSAHPQRHNRCFFTFHLPSVVIGCLHTQSIGPVQHSPCSPIPSWLLQRLFSPHAHYHRSSASHISTYERMSSIFLPHFPFRRYRLLSAVVYLGLSRNHRLRKTISSSLA